MRAILCLALIVTVAACGGTAAPKRAAVSHHATSAALSSPPAPFYPTPPPNLPIGPPIVAPPYNPPQYASPGIASAATYARLATFNCRVPISNGQPGSGGFIAIPGGAFTSDPASNIAIDWNSAPAPTQTPPPGPGYAGRPPVYGLSFDRAVGKWLPVSPNWVAPDGQHYAYPDFVGGGVRYASAADGSAVTMGGSKKWNVLDVEAEGVYAVPFDPQGAPPNGLWLLAPGKDPVQIVASGYWQWVTTGYAYGFDAPSVPQGAPHPLLRLRLRDHTVVTWYQQGETIQWIPGFDNDGSPVVVITPNYQQYYGQVPVETALIPRPDEKQTLMVTPQGASTPVIRDSRGFWMVSDVLYFDSVPVTRVGGQLGGGCGS